MPPSRRCASSTGSSRSWSIQTSANTPRRQRHSTVSAGLVHTMHACFSGHGRRNGPQNACLSVHTCGCAADVRDVRCGHMTCGCSSCFQQLLHGPGNPGAVWPQCCLLHMRPCPAVLGDAQKELMDDEKREHLLKVLEVARGAQLGTCASMHADMRGRRWLGSTDGHAQTACALP